MIFAGKVLNIVVSLLLLGAIIIAFLAEPSAGTVLFSSQNSVTMALAGTQTVLLIRHNPLLWCLLLLLSVAAGLAMHSPLAEKSPTACIMCVTAGHVVFERLQHSARELDHLVKKMGTAASRLVERIEAALN